MGPREIMELELMQLAIYYFCFCQKSFNENDFWELCCVNDLLQGTKAVDVADVILCPERGVRERTAPLNKR